MNPLPPYRCLIVDDEPIARQILRNYIARMPNLECVGECKNAFEALETINAAAGVQLIFLDINMPNLSGTALARILSGRVQVVFTTAYAAYAVESYELNATDYLLKPFLFERFAQAVFKAIERLKAGMPPGEHAGGITEIQPLVIKSDGEMHQVLPEDILYCEAMKNYTKVVTVHGKNYYPLMAFSKFELALQATQQLFLRVHRSYIIAKKYVGPVGANYIMVDQYKIPIGLQYKDSVLAQLRLK
jgi:DNA-binding LytR/AlgR family response regulator